MSGIAMILVVHDKMEMTGPMEVEMFMNNHVLGLTILSNMLTLLVLFLFFRVRNAKFVSETNLKRVEWKECILPSLAAFSFSMSFSLMTYHMNFENAKQIQMSAAYYSQKAPYLGVMLWVIAILIMAPITEEVICRGLVLTRLQRKMGDAAAVLISGLLFGMLHLAAGGIVLAAGAAIMGVIFGTISVKMKSLVPAVIAHSAANMADLVIVLIPELSQGMRYGLMGIFLIAFIFLYVVFGEKGRKSTKGINYEHKNKNFY